MATASTMVAMATAITAGAHITTRNTTTKVSTLSTMTVVAANDEAANAARPHASQEVGGEREATSSMRVALGGVGGRN